MKKNNILLKWPDANDAATALAHLIILKSREATAKHGFFTIALSGGSTPSLLYAKLAQSSFADNIDWKKVFVFFSDERFVPPTSNESNFKMASDILLKHIPLPKRNILSIKTVGVSPKDAALAYEKKIKQYITPSHPFDFVLLGMGDDGHTASLFPKKEILTEKKRLVKEVFLAEKNSHRISFTFPLINTANTVAFLVCGDNKALMLKKIFTQKNNSLPAALVKPKGQLFWFVDNAAASRLLKQ